jgi:hypothetical protein
MPQRLPAALPRDHRTTALFWFFFGKNSTSLTTAKKIQTPPPTHMCPLLLLLQAPQAAQAQAGYYGQQQPQQMAHNPYAAMWPQVREGRSPTLPAKTINSQREYRTAWRLLSAT